MNSAHLEFCASPEWRTIVEEMILPDALRNAKLGTEVIEIGPGPGFTTDVLRKLTDHLIAVEVDPNLAVALKTRLQGTNVEVVCGDATSLDFPDDRFSAAASFQRHRLWAVCPLADWVLIDHPPAATLLGEEPRAASSAFRDYFNVQAVGQPPVSWTEGHRRRRSPFLWRRADRVRTRQVHQTPGKVTFLS